MKTSRIVLLSFLLSIMLLPYQIGQSQSLNPQTGNCHFGITIPYDVDSYDLSILGVDSYLDWASGQKSSAVADNIQYIRVIRVDDANYATNLAAIPTLIATYPGSIWIIGNEPDSQVTFQDHVSAEVYAQRFYDMAQAIRNDATAKIGFGAVIQPTPVRIYYLDKVIARLTELAGNDLATALGLIDIYTVHAFILNEDPTSWGAGVPVGYDLSWPDYQVLEGQQTFDINLFKSRVTDFRQWMKDLGQQSKPLWITEYGSLFPVSFGVSELTTATYMEQTFDYMLGTKDPALGLSTDDNRLVQKWFWYSLNDFVDHFGGSLYNPQTRQMTTVGNHFIDYTPSLSAVPATSPDVYIDTSNPMVAPGPYGHYRISLKVGNNVSTDRLTPVRVDLFLAGNQVGSIDTNLPRCSGKISVSFDVGNLQAGQSYSFSAQVSPLNATDIDDLNNVMNFQPIMMPEFKNIFIPGISR